MQNNRKRKLVYLCAGISNGRAPDSVEGLLISTACDCKTPGTIQNAKTLIQNKTPKDITLDSGGYQLHIAERKGIPPTFNPDEPLKVTEKGFNIISRHVPEMAIVMGATNMVALDFPIRKIKDPAGQEKEFRSKLSRKVQWAIETAALRKELCPHIGLLVAVQAYTEKQLEEFYRKIHHAEFDGLSLPVRNMTMATLAGFMLKIHKWGVRQVHILGSSSLPVMSVCAYMSQRFFDRVSFDATTWRIAAQFGQFIHPYDLSSKKLNKAQSYDPHYRCACRFCKGRTLGTIAEMDRKERMALLMNHNHLAIQNVCKKFGEADFDYRYLEKYLKNSKRKDIKKILRSMSEIETMCSPYTTRSTGRKTSIEHSHGIRQII